MLCFKRRKLNKTEINRSRSEDSSKNYAENDEGVSKIRKGHP